MICMCNCVYMCVDWFSEVIGIPHFMAPTLKPSDSCQAVAEKAPCSMASVANKRLGVNAAKMVMKMVSNDAGISDGRNCSNSWGSWQNRGYRLVAVKLCMDFLQLATLWLKKLQNLQDQPQRSLVRINRFRTAVTLWHRDTIECLFKLQTPSISRRQIRLEGGCQIDRHSGYLWQRQHTQAPEPIVQLHVGYKMVQNGSQKATKNLGKPLQSWEERERTSQSGEGRGQELLSHCADDMARNVHNTLGRKSWFIWKLQSVSCDPAKMSKNCSKALGPIKAKRLSGSSAANAAPRTVLR